MLPPRVPLGRGGAAETVLLEADKTELRVTGTDLSAAGVRRAGRKPMDGRARPYACSSTTSRSFKTWSRSTCCPSNLALPQMRANLSRAAMSLCT